MTPSDRIENKDITKFQVMMNSIFRSLRTLNRLIPALPGKRFWRFSAGLKIVLTLVPPHRTYGPMTHGMVEPIFCGAWHDSMNICTFCPGREYVTFNFSVEQRYLPMVDKVLELMEKTEALELTATGRRAVEDETA